MYKGGVSIYALGAGRSLGNVLVKGPERPPGAAHRSGESHLRIEPVKQDPVSK